jgi:hypothetical protein
MMGPLRWVKTKLPYWDRFARAREYPYSRQR